MTLYASEVNFPEIIILLLGCYLCEIIDVLIVKAIFNFKISVNFNQKHHNNFK